MTSETMDPNYPIVGKIPSGLFIVGVAAHGRKEAFLASWVQQVSLEPIRLSVVMDAERPAFVLAQEVGHFTVNMLGEGNSAQMKPFWGGLKSGQAPLDVVSHTLGEEGSLRIDGVLGFAHCSIEAIHEVGKHRMVIGLVKAHQLMNTEDKPKVHIRFKGNTY